MDNKAEKVDGSDSSVLQQSNNSILRLGIIGAGGFATFAAKAFLKIKGIKIIAVTDAHLNTAAAFAETVHAEVYDDDISLLENKNVDLIYIATPPFLHYQQSKKALMAGKHVICEKPAALRVHEAEELVSLAESKNLLYVVNLMQRYNPLYTFINIIVKENNLGAFLHGFFENYASDENLGADHWFWEESKSGGIFIEHGVHFFDMFSGWLGEGKVLSSVILKRQTGSTQIIDRVNALVKYKDGLVNFYHGFDQPKILDRQEMRLQFERGEITLYGWIPVKMKLHGLFKEEEIQMLKDMIGNVTITYNGHAQTQHKATGRFKEIYFDKELTLEYGHEKDKAERYEQLLLAMLNDQWLWIKDRNHKRIINGTNAVESLKIAVQAAKMAQQF